VNTAFAALKIFSSPARYAATADRIPTPETMQVRRPEKKPPEIIFEKFISKLR
jgi:hypothetical protein